MCQENVFILKRGGDLTIMENSIKKMFFFYWNLPLVLEEQIAPTGLLYWAFRAHKMPLIPFLIHCGNGTSSFWGCWYVSLFWVPDTGGGNVAWVEFNWLYFEWIIKENKIVLFSEFGFSSHLSNPSLPCLVFCTDGKYYL